MGSIPATARLAKEIDQESSRIIDIRSDAAGISLKQQIFTGLRPQLGEEKTLPTLLLYDVEGLKLFEQITFLDEYYLTGAEMQILQQNAGRIAERIPNDALVVELGSGNLRKIRILLDALDRAGKKISYFALDLMQSELDRTLDAIPPDTFDHVTCSGLLGTYDDGLEWLRRPENVTRPKAILSMGSSIGNFIPEDAAGFIAQFAAELGPDDMMIVGVDGCRDPDRVYHAYNDREDVTHKFTMNGLRHANRLLGHDAFDISDWEAVGEFDEAGSRHRAYVVPKRDVSVAGASIGQGSKVRIEESYKYSQDRAAALWSASGVMESAFWSTEGEGSYKLHLLTRPMMSFPVQPEEYAPHPVPSLAEWRDLWNVWDIVTRQMIRDDELYEKPIKLRNACIFYLGHIPTFFDIKLTEATKGAPTEPKYFYSIFERGIDPDVDNPEHCHAHSEIPSEWPELTEILKYQDSVRDRVRGLYDSGAAYNDAWTGRAIWLGFEHEIMHLETLLYMLIQSEKTLPPPGTGRPDFEQLAAQASRDAVDNEWFDIPDQQLRVGLDDPDNADGAVRYFGWDVERPSYETKVKAFKAKARPITNEEYAKYLSTTGKAQLPASWAERTSNGVNGANGVSSHHANEDTGLHAFLRGKTVRTIYGQVPLKHALDWPVSASYDELAGCAAYMGGRIPTADETRSIYTYAETIKKETAAKALDGTIPAVNGHLVNEGVEESPPSKHFVNGHSSKQAGPDPNELFVDLTKANVGFKHWHPMPVTQNGGKLSGQAEMGGLWEWTSSPLEKTAGFEPMKLYPAYSADFYDTKHNIVLGGSWATHPRVAGRKTFVNWFQRNYLYVWAGARLVKDA